MTYPNFKCVTIPGGLVEISPEFTGALTEISDDIYLALEYIELFGGVPKPVAQAILRNLGPVETAIDMALRSKDLALPSPEEKVG
jgi:hypothetical protein